jgi:hypothetical protein
MTKETHMRVQLSYDSPEHRTYCDLLREYGFSSIIDRNYNVGFQFFNPRHGVIVILDVEDSNTYEPKILKLKDNKKWHSVPVPHIVDFFAPTEQDYTEFEWAWINEMPSSVETLRRELYILLRVRPDTLARR